MTNLNAERTRQAIIDHTRRLAESAIAAQPDAPVPTAPKWTVTDLVTHVGQTQHWVAEIIERRITDPAQLPTEMTAPPSDTGEWSAWLSVSAQRVVDACSDDALDAPVFNAAGDGRSGTQFWMSSMLNEAVIHGFDAAAAANHPADIDTPVDADIAAALISNHLAMLTSPTWKFQRPESARRLCGTGQTLQWQATDIVNGTNAWFIERQPEGPAWRATTERADVTITGPARSLLLILTRRVPLPGEKDSISISGDTSLARQWIDNTAHASD